jgi:hypothetical protein
MPRIYAKSGIQFQYPDNWTLDEEKGPGNRSVTVYSPGGGFWSVAMHRRGDDRERLAQAVLQAMREEYEDLESEPVREVIAGQELLGYDINFCYLDLTSTATVRCVERGDATLVIFCEAEDRDFERLGAVFAAMTYSLMNRPQ